MTRIVTLSIDNIEVKVPENYTILMAAKEVGIHIPTLCFLKDINEVGACRVCLVEIEGARGLQAACVHPVSEGLIVKTNSKKVREARTSTVELILSNHNRECLTCSRNRKCELQTIAEELNINQISFKGSQHFGIVDDQSHSIVRDQSKCILCGRCVSTCKKVQNIGILDFVNRGFGTEVAPAFNKGLDEVPCINCGQCVVACPVAALKEKDETTKVWEALENKDLHVIVQTAPAVRAALGEEFGMPLGSRVTGKMVASLRRLGFEKVYDTNFAADLTIMEEGYELLDRLENGGTLPMITSCSPGWVNYCEYYYPEFIPNLSSCKSPHQMFGAIAKTYYAQKMNLDPKKLFVVSVMPCVAKKSESKRPELEGDVDVVITTRELAKMIRQGGIQFNSLNDEDFDYDFFGEYTGAGVIFGATGGVMEAALRTVADVLTGEDLKSIEYKNVRGIDGIKEASLTLNGKTINIAVAHGTAMAKKLLDIVKNNEKEYHFIEIMGCSGGCVTGGGQPFVSPKIKMDCDIRVERAKALYDEDKKMELRKSHQNPLIIKLYEEFLGKPNSEKAHDLLHTHYYKKEQYPNNQES